MDLLVFAHRGEAQAFFSRIAFSRVEGSLAELYQSSDYFLLISKEGQREALKSTLLTLSGHPIKRVFNLGIAGGLNSKLQIGDIVSIRTSYCLFNSTPFFKSYSSSSSGSLYDCVTFNQRVLSPQDSGNLFIHGDIVDRELWGIAEACSVFKIPFFSYKLISDMAGDTHCSLVLENAADYSYRLFDYFEKNHLPFSPTAEDSLPLEIETFIKSLAPTFSQRVQLEKLFKKCLLKKNSLKEFLNLSQYKDWPRKKRNQDIIKRLSQKIDPIQFELERISQELSLPPSVKMIPNPESIQLEIKAQITNEEERKKLIENLKKISFEKIRRFYEGGPLDF